MKIIFAIDTLETGGAERSTLDIVSRLSKDITPIIVTFYKGKSLLKYFPKDTNVRFVHFDLQGKYDFSNAIKLFKELCIEERPNLVVATLFRSEIITRIVCKRLGIRNIGTFVSDPYSDITLREQPLMQRLKVLLWGVVNAYTAQYCYKFLANSECIKLSNAKALKVPLSKVDVVYRGRDTKKFKAIFDERFATERIRFVNVGRLLPWKGQKELIEAFALFHKQFPDSELRIAGEGKYKPELEHTIARHNIGNAVTLLGNVHDVPALLAKADVFVFPSHFEGFSGALVEAMLSGIPVLASDITMNQEAVTHLDSGYLFQVQSKEAILSAMNYAVSHKEEMIRMAKKARTVAEEKFDIERIARQYNDSYIKYTA